jgi:hypothetical protein
MIRFVQLITVSGRFRTCLKLRECAQPYCYVVIKLRRLNTSGPSSMFHIEMVCVFLVGPKYLLNINK